MGDERAPTHRCARGLGDGRSRNPRAARVGTPVRGVGTAIIARRFARFEFVGVAVVVFLATLLSGYWAFRVPMFLEPDEIAHADAAFAYFDAGRPFDARGARATNFVTPEVRYLVRSEGYRRLRYDAHAVVAHAYGTRSFFRALDRGAPVPADRAGRVSIVPYALAVYPSTYYAAVAATMRTAWYLFDRSISAAFFAGRLLNSSLLAVTLVFAYLILRESHLSAVQRSLAFVGIAFFPMSTWMSAYVQPDNASALFLTIALYCALVLRRDPGNAGAMSGLGVAIAMLGVTKLQYAVVAIVAFAVALRHAFDREATAVKARALAIGIALPLLAIVAGHYLTPLGAIGLPPAGSGYDHVDAASAAATAVATFARGVGDAWFGGSAFRSFWFHFGIRSEGAFPDAVAGDVTTVLVVLTAIAFAAWILRETRFALDLRDVASRKGVRRALRSLGTDPSLNLYALLSVVLFALYAFTDGYLVLQGRYWYPVLVPIVVVSVRVAGGVLRGVRARAARLGTVSAVSFYALVPEYQAALYPLVLLGTAMELSVEGPALLRIARRVSRSRSTRRFAAPT